MLDLGLRLMTSLGLSSAEVMVDAGRAFAGDDGFDVRPHQFRRLLLSFEESIQGRIPDILGEDEEERVDTLVRLLRGTSERDLHELIGSLSLALERLHAEEDRADRRLALSDARSSLARRGGRRDERRRPERLRRDR